ncbi:MAG: hypothetical protein ACTSVU_03655 [Promethearchaeota archaeon]
MKKNQLYNLLIFGFLTGLMILSSSLGSTLAYSSEKSTSNDNGIPLAAPGSWNNVTLPAGEVPTANITLQKGDQSRMFTLEQIINYTTYENHTFQMKNYTLEKDNASFPVIGFNPIHLFEIAGWNDILNFTIKAGDGYNYIVNTTQLLLADSDYAKYTETTNETIIIIAWNNQWLRDFDSDYGDFYLWGENISVKQKIKDIVSIEYADSWTLSLTINGTTAGYFNSLNGTNSVNYTSYNWGYFDSAAGYGWSECQSTGFTVASIIEHITTENYNVSFIAYDGYGAKKVFTKNQMVNGFTGSMINDPSEELSNEGKQAMLMIQKNGKDLGYARGPYQLIVPGADKGNYIGGIVEIRITIIPTTTTSSIPGFSIFSIGIVSIAMIAIMFANNRKYNNK